jgi:hypothetical protein
VLSKLLSLKSLCVATLLSAACGAQAEITVYTNQADFLNAVKAPGVDTYDDLALAPYDETLLRSAGAYTYSAYSGGGLYGAGVPGDSWLSNNYPNNPIVFSSFSGNVSAFGGSFFASDVFGGYVPGGSLVLTALDGSALSYSLEGATRDGFLGFVSDAPLAGVTLQGLGGGEYWPTANNVVLAVPEPGTYAMLLAGLGFVGVLSRRRER